MNKQCLLPILCCVSGSSHKIFFKRHLLCDFSYTNSCIPVPVPEAVNIPKTDKLETLACIIDCIFYPDPHDVGLRIRQQPGVHKIATEKRISVILNSIISITSNSNTVR